MNAALLHEDAKKLIIGLSEPKAVEKFGQTWCTVNQLMLQMCLNSCTPEETNERLEKMVNDIRVKLGVKES